MGTYRSQPADGHEGMTIGLSQFRDERVIWLHWMLVLPFIGRNAEYPINRRRRDSAWRKGDHAQYPPGVTGGPRVPVAHQPIGKGRD